VRETHEEHEPVGGVADEAVRLLAALSGWAKQQTDGFSALGDEAPAHSHGTGLPDDIEGMAGAAPECAWCPLCRALAAVRRIPPEVRDHLTEAGTSLLQAVSAMMATDPPSPARDDDDADSGTRSDA
jgi:hypothetical protein